MKIKNIETMRVKLERTPDNEKWISQMFECLINGGHYFVDVYQHAADSDINENEYNVRVKRMYGREWKTGFGTSITEAIKRALNL